ncbi:hypothetical protein CVT24_001971 [Panaeolus cyanescens]|uniref:Protein kinase domain-containing protein n=1 Tax=Panaeolus cyanescens TaxID=181874 RepID=A0A409YHR4_9AGAR|nr:hypothetical protein CVT24_001971 [Panaeolus cyanescens]
MDWINTLNIPDGPYKEHLKELLKPQKDASFHIHEAHLSREDFVLGPPMCLEDTHVSQELILRHVQYAPSLLEDLREEFYSQLEQFLKTKGIPDLENSNLPKINAFGGRLSKLADMVILHVIRVGSLGLRYSSHMHILPDTQAWNLPWFHVVLKDQQPFINGAIIIPDTDENRPFDPYAHLSVEDAKTIAPSILEKLEAACNSSSSPAVFMFYPPTGDGETIIDDFAEPGFKYTVPKADSHNIPTPTSTSTSFLSCDWPASFWAKYLDQREVPKGMTTGPTSSRFSKTVYVPGPQTNPSEEYTPLVPHFVQHAWNIAAERDATFLLVSCGTKERIGIRHRATNTLFLSDVIRPDDEDYIITQVAFYSAFTRDFVARELPPKLSIKRKRPEHDLLENPRLPLPQAKTDKSTDKIFNKEFSSRPIVLLTFDMKNHRSIAPSTFLREQAFSAPVPTCTPFTLQQEGRTCSVTECVYIQVQKYLADGREGIVYKGTATLHLESGMTVRKNVVVKVPKPQYVRHLEHEYDKYWKLAAAGVSEGLLKVYGLFKDVEFGTTILVMQDGGVTLERREQRRLGLKETPNQFRISDEEYAVLRRTVLAINKAGIIHKDIKPNNILIDDDGQPYIIDFGHAEVWKYSRFAPEKYSPDPPWSEIDSKRREIVEASISDLPDGIRSYDLQVIEDIYIGRYWFNRRYPGRW